MGLCVASPAKAESLADVVVPLQDTAGTPVQNTAGGEPAFAKKACPVEVDDHCDIVTLGKSPYHKEISFWNAKTVDGDLHSDAVIGLSVQAVVTDHLQTPHTRAGAIASDIVDQMRYLTDEVGREQDDVVDRVWSGPSECGGDLISWLMGSTAMVGSKKVIEDRVCHLCDAARRLLLAEPTLLELRAPIKIFGDIHGQLRDLLTFFLEFGRPCTGRGGDIELVSYLFNGDWVDRGAHQIEVVLILLAIKVMYPERIWLLRGNHEDEQLNKYMKARGFHAACVGYFGMEAGMRVFGKFQTVFDVLPMAATIDAKVLVVHGGIGDGKWSLSQLRDDKSRPLTHDKLMGDPLLYNLLWSDPVPEDADGQNPYGPNATFGVHDSPRDKHRHVTKCFGADVTEQFCKANGLDLIIRSHQCTLHGHGYTLMHQGRLLRVFSARDYDDHANAGALLLISYKNLNESGERALVVRPKILQPLGSNKQSSVLLADPD